MTEWREREAVLSPGLKATNDVTCELEAKLDEVVCGKDGRIAVVADQNEALVEPAEVPVPPRAIDGDPPFEHGSRDVQTPGDNAVKLAGIL